MFTGLKETTLGDVLVAVAPGPSRVTDTAVGAHGVYTLPVPCAGQVHGQTLIDVCKLKILRGKRLIIARDCNTCTSNITDIKTMIIPPMLSAVIT